MTDRAVNRVGPPAREASRVQQWGEAEETLAVGELPPLSGQFEV